MVSPWGNGSRSAGQSPRYGGWDQGSLACSLEWCSVPGEGVVTDTRELVEGPDSQNGGAC